MKQIIKLLTIGCVVSSITGCIPLVLGGAGAAGGYAVAKDKGPVGQYTDDSVITSKVKAKFVADSRLQSYNISVATDKGIVILTGAVPTQEMRNVAVSIATSVHGVRAVNVTNLRVNG